MEDLRKLIDELKEEVNKLQEENQTLSSKIWENELKDYLKVFNTINLALEKGDLLERDFKETWKNIQKDDLQQDFSEANNPTSGSLGFKFTDVIIKAVESAITEKVEFSNPEKNKARWTELVKKVVDNDLVSSLLKSNPITATVSSVITSAANFFESKIDAEVEKGQGGMRVIKAASEITNVIKKERIEEFIKEITPYTEFYESLSEATSIYQSELLRMNAKAESLKNTAADFYTSLNTTLKFSTGSNFSSSAQLRDLFEYDKKSNQDFDFNSVIKSSIVESAYKIASSYESVKTEVDQFMNDYNNIYKAHLIRNKKIFQNTLDGQTSVAVNTSVVRNLIDKIDQNIEQIGNENSLASFTIKSRFLDVA